MFSVHLLFAKASWNPALVYGNDPVTLLTVRQATLTYPLDPAPAREQPLKTRFGTRSSQPASLTVLT